MNETATRCAQSKRIVEFFTSPISGRKCETKYCGRRDVRSTDNGVFCLECYQRLPKCKTDTCTNVATVSGICEQCELAQEDNSYILCRESNLSRRGEMYGAHQDERAFTEDERKKITVKFREITGFQRDDGFVFGGRA